MAPGHTSVAGTVVGTLAGLGVFAAIVYFSIYLPHWRRKRREKKARKNIDPERGDEGGHQELTGIDPAATNKDAGDAELEATRGPKGDDHAEDRNRTDGELETRNSPTRGMESRSAPNEVEANNPTTVHEADANGPQRGVGELEPTPPQPKELPAESSHLPKSISTQHAVTRNSGDSSAISPQTQNGMAFSEPPQSEPVSTATTPPASTIPDGSTMSDAEYERYLRELQKRHDQVQTRKETLLQLQKIQQEEDQVREEMAALKQGRGRRQEVVV